MIEEWLSNLTNDDLVQLMHKLTLEVYRRNGDDIEAAIERTGIPASVRRKAKPQ